MPVEVVRFDDYPAPEVGDEYHGFNLTYTEPGYVVRARYYEHRPDELVLFPLADPPRQGFGKEIPYAGARLGRAARELLASVPATRLILDGRGVDGVAVEVDPNALAGYCGPDNIPAR